MNNKQNLSKIAKLLVQNGKVDSKIADKLINNLSRKNLAVFARIVERYSKENTVKVFSGIVLSSEIKKQISAKFPGRTVIFEHNSNIGDGIQLIINDTIIDLTINGLVESAIDKIKIQN